MPQDYELIVKFLQLCLSPIALISGVGLLLLTISNRFGRVVDRTRVVLRELEPHQPAKEYLRQELHILLDRARLLRNSILALVAVILCASLLLFGVFLMLWLGPAVPWIGTVSAYGIPVLLLLGIVGLIVSILYFLLDVLQALAALKLEIHAVKHGP